MVLFLTQKFYFEEITFNFTLKEDLDDNGRNVGRRYSYLPPLTPPARYYPRRDDFESLVDETVWNRTGNTKKGNRDTVHTILHRAIIG